MGLHDSKRRAVGQRRFEQRLGVAGTVQVSADSAKRWVATLAALYFCFTIKPWHRKVARALRKEPKHYLWDWSEVAEAGPRAENLVASLVGCAVASQPNLM